jgi:hypothetical protein
MKKKNTFFVALISLFTVASVNAQVYSDDFESSSTVASGWRDANFAGATLNTTLSINTASVMTGVNALQFTTSANSGNWFENVAGYSFPATIADQYDITFDAKASAAISIQTELNTDGNDGQTDIINQTLALTTASQHFALTTTSGCTKTKNYLFWFVLNKSAGTDIYVDNFLIKKKVSTGIDGASKINISYYPNPAKDFVLIKGQKEGVAVAIYSLAGQLVLSSVIDGKPLSLKNINTGAYLLKVGDTTQKLMIKK